MRMSVANMSTFKWPVRYFCNVRVISGTADYQVIWWTIEKIMYLALMLVDDCHSAYCDLVDRSYDGLAKEGILSLKKRRV
jgi:hypothetical protein